MRTEKFLLLVCACIMALVNAKAQSYTFNPSLQTYTTCGSGNYESAALSYDNCCFAGGYETFQQGHVRVALWARSSSTGTLSFRVAKCDGYYANGNSGKVLIVDNYWGDIYCSNWYIDDNNTPFVTAKIYNYGDFTGRRSFDVFLITADQVYRFYAGKITIQAGSAPISNVYEPTNVTATSATFNGCVNPNNETTQYRFLYGTSLTYTDVSALLTLEASDDCVDVSADITGLSPETTYYYKLFAINSSGYAYSTNLYSFTTLADGSAPTAYTTSASDVTSSSARLKAQINPGGKTTHYYFQYGTSTSYGSQTITGTLPADHDTHSVYADVTGLEPNTTYYFRIYAYNSQGEDYGSNKSFTTDVDDCFFPDCSSASNCGNASYAASIYEAVQYLCDHNIVNGDANTGYVNVDAPITRGQLAKITLYGLYDGENNVPNPLVTDYFPVIYTDLCDNSTYFYRPARTLMYLEYGDGVSPFDRNRTCFNPQGNISRCHVLKVLLEAFNIAPLTGGTNVFDDFGPAGYANSEMWGYCQKAYNLNIVQTTHMRPNDNCTRGEAFLYLLRILTNSNISIPTPVNSEDPSISSFFIPSNLSLETLNAIRGVEYGNFKYYNKDFFYIPGYQDLEFGISYNSYMTELPNDIFPVMPLGTSSWTHTYNYYLNKLHDDINNNDYYIFHLETGLMLVYDNNLQSITEGNYTVLTASGTNKYILTTQKQERYTFERFSYADGIYYLTEIKDRNNNTVTLSYQNGHNHYRISSVTTLGRTLEFHYQNNSDCLSYVKDPANREVHFNFNGDKLVSLTDAKNQGTQFTYGTFDFESGLLKEITLPKGNHVYNNYNQRKLVSTRINNGSPTTITLTSNYQNGTVSSTVSQPVNGSQDIVTQYTMNSNGRIIQVHDNLNLDVSYAYNNNSHPGLVSSKTDNKKNIQYTFSYTSNGMLSSSTMSAGGQTRSWTYSYNSTNDLVAYTDANGNTTNLHYTNGNVTSIVNARGETTNITRNSHGSPTVITNPLGVATTFDYNSYGNVIGVTQPSLNISETFTYDNLSRITEMVNYENNSSGFSYDDNDNLLSKTDAQNNNTYYNYDENDNLVGIVNSKGFTTNLTYDNNDFLSTMEFQGQTRSYTYNRDGSLKTYTSPNGHTDNYSYNNSGDLTDDGYATYSYNSRGLLESVTKDNLSIQMSYDGFGDITSTSYNGNTVSYTRDNNGNVLSITYPGNKTVYYTYDELNRMTSATDWNNSTTIYVYRADNQLDYLLYPNAVMVDYTYDNGGRCTGLSARRNSGGGSVIASYNFNLDNLGNHLQESLDEPFGGFMDTSSVSINYTYDNANRMLTAGTYEFCYDANGNTISRTGRTYSYDNRNMLTSVTGDFNASYTYDGLGYRRSATRNGETVNYVLDIVNGNGDVLMETDASGNPLYYYVYGACGLIARINASNQTHYYVFDYRHSTVAMVDATTSANVTHRYQYDDFGNVLQQEELDMNRFRYVGQLGVMYESNDLVFMRKRYYDSGNGRFLSEDPLWSCNLYVYSTNNPINQYDASGLLETPINVINDNPLPAGSGAASAICKRKVVMDFFKKQLFAVLKGKEIGQLKDTAKSLMDNFEMCKDKNPKKDMDYQAFNAEKARQKADNLAQSNRLRDGFLNSYSNHKQEIETAETLAVVGIIVIVVVKAIGTVFAPEAAPLIWAIW